LSLEECLARLRYVKYGDEVLSSDHNTKVECLKLLRDRIVALADRLGVRGLVDPKLERLDVILAQLKYRTALDIIDPDDHNLLVDGLKVARDALAELEAVAVAPPPPPPPAPPPPPPRAGLWYRMSTSRFEFTVYEVEDPESVLTFTLPEDSYVLVVYNASNRRGNVESSAGKTCLLNIDGINLPDTWADQAANRINSSSNITCIWAGRLPAGAHTVKAIVSCRYFVGIDRCGIDARQMIVLAVPASAGPLVYGSSAMLKLEPLIFYEIIEEPPVTPHGDPFAILRLALNSEANVLAIYNMSKFAGGYTVDECKGSGAVITVDGLPVLESACNRSVSSRYFATKVTSVVFTKLGPGVHTVFGGFSFTYAYTRTLAYVVVPREWVSAGRTSSVRVEGNSSTMGSPPPWDDPEAVVTVDLPEDSRCLVVYSVANSYNRPESIEGKFTLINIDGVDMPESFASQSAGSSNCANHVLSLWAGRLTAGTHVIKGRWGSNIPTETTGIDRRVIAVICIPESLLI
jgi:hypothetical protein